MHIPFGRIVVYGFLTYAVVFMLWTFLYSYGIASVLVWGQTASVLNYVVVALSVFFAARYVGISSLKDALVYGAGLACVHLVLDIIYITPAAGVAALLVPSTWLNYLLVFVTPLATVLYMRATAGNQPPMTPGEIIEATPL